MKLKDLTIALMMAFALLGMAVLLFNVPVGIDTKTFGAWTFGAILVFGIINIILVLIDSFQKPND